MYGYMRCIAAQELIRSPILWQWIASICTWYMCVCNLIYSHGGYLYGANYNLTEIVTEREMRDAFGCLACRHMLLQNG